MPVHRAHQRKSVQDPSGPLALAKMGYELMDRKRNILIREMMLLIDSAKQIQAEIDTTFTRAYSALQEANIKLGACQDIAWPPRWTIVCSWATGR